MGDQILRDWQDERVSHVARILKQLGLGGHKANNELGASSAICTAQSID
jgi:hypothetical protein